MSEKGSISVLFNRRNILLYYFYSLYFARIERAEIQYLSALFAPPNPARAKCLWERKSQF